MPWRNLPIPDGLPPVDAFYHIVALARDPLERARYERVEVSVGVHLILVTTAEVASQAWDAARLRARFNYFTAIAMRG